MANDWLELRQHADTGIETIKAHFEGHAFDPHWHDSYLVGITSPARSSFTAAVSVIVASRATHFSSSLARSTTVMRL
jgi:hypothetical protein